MASVSEQQLQEWKEKYGDVYEVRVSDDEEKLPVFYFKKPGRGELSRFSKEMMSNMYNALNNMVFACLIHPSAEVVAGLVNDKPGLVISLGAELQKIAGSNQNFTSKRL